MRNIGSVTQQFTCPKCWGIAYSGFLIEVAPGNNVKWCTKCVHKLTIPIYQERTIIRETQYDNAQIEERGSLSWERFKTIIFDQNVLSIVLISIIAFFISPTIIKYFFVNFILQITQNVSFIGLSIFVLLIIWIFVKKIPGLFIKIINFILGSLVMLSAISNFNERSLITCIVISSIISISPFVLDRLIGYFTSNFPSSCLITMLYITWKVIAQTLSIILLIVLLHPQLHELEQINQSIQITSLRVGNYSNDGKWLNTPGSNLQSSEMRFLKPQLTLSANSNGNVTFYVKIIGPNGSIITGDSSPEGYSFSTTCRVRRGNNQNLDLNGWGNSETSIYQTGVYMMEIWYNNECLISGKINIYD